MKFSQSTIYSLKKEALAALPFSLEPESREHEESEEIVLYRCEVCGNISKSIGFLHGHMEGHTPWYSVADVSRFKDWTEKIVVEEYREVPIEDYSDENL